jgi:hypothetical protein
MKDKSVHELVPLTGIWEDPGELLTRIAREVDAWAVQRTESLAARQDFETLQRIVRWLREAGFNIREVKP